MASTDVEGRASAQPSSYEHMEEALSKITAKPGEDTQELSDERQRTRQEINEKVDLPSIDQEEESSDTSGHSHDAARSNGVKERQDCSIDDEKLQPGVNAAIEGVGQKVSPPKAPTQVIAVAIPSGTSNHRPPQLRPLAPSPSEHASAFQQEASTENLKVRSSSSVSGDFELLSKKLGRLSLYLLYVGHPFFRITRSTSHRWKEPCFIYVAIELSNERARRCYERI